MWWKVLLACLMCLGGLLWFVYRFGKELAEPAQARQGSRLLDH